MADNLHPPFTGSSGEANPPVATDDVGGVHYQVVKLDLGGNGVSVPVSTSVPISGAVTVSSGSVTLSGTGAVNVAQINGATPDIGGGNAGSGTLRVVLATDQPQPTNAFRVSGNINAGVADSGGPVKIGGKFNTTPPTLTDGQRGDVQLNATGSIRVDPSGVTSPVSGTVTANAGTGTFATNVAQINGAAPDIGGGNAGSGTLRVVLATDQPSPTNTFKVVGSAASGAAAAGAPVRVGARFNTTPPTFADGNAADLQVNSSGALKIDGSAVTQPVSGTITANIGTSGSLALDASVTGLQVSQGSTTSGQKGSLAQAAVTTGNPSYTTAQTSPLSLDTSGGLRVHIIASDVSSSGGTSAADGATYTAGTTAGTPMMGARDDTSPGVVAEDKVGIVRMSTRRELYSQIRDAAGNERGVNVTAGNALVVDASATTQPVSGTVTANAGSGTFTTSDAQTIADNAAFTDGTSKVFMGGYVFDEVAGTALTENDAAAARIDSKRAQVGVLEDATTRGQRAAVSAAGRLSVDASGVAVPVTDNAGSLTVDAPVGTPVFVRLSDGTAALTTTSGRLAVDGSGVTQPVSGTVSVNLNAGTNTNEVVGDVAQDAAIAGNPLSMGGRASSAVPTAMSADGDSVYVWLDRSGGQVVNGRDAHDAALDANTNPVLVGGRASAAAPTDVSADGDAARAWFLRNGAQATVVTAAGALIGGDAANGLDVDVTRVSGTVTVTGTVTTTPPSNASTNVAQFGGTNVVTGTGASGAGIPRVTVSNDSTVTSNAATQGGKAAPGFAKVDTAASGDTTIVAADATRKIKVVSYVLVGASGVSVKWKSGGATDLTGAMPFAANGGVSAIGSFDAHLLETAANQALVLNLSGAFQVSGHISYFLET